MNVNKKILVPIFLLAVSFGAGFNYGRSSIPSSSMSQNILGLVKGENTVDEEKADFGIFWDTWEALDKNYALSPLDEKAMVYGAISGMVDSLGDPYTVFMTPDENESLSEDMSGFFGGIGAEVGFRNGFVTVIAPLKGSPAEKSGLLSGDKIIEVGEENVEDYNVDEVVNLIRGEEGTKVTLVILRGEEVMNFEIMREEIADQTVKWEMKENGVVYLEIRQFKRETAGELDAQIGDILSQDPKGIVLDLRNNPGGYLDVVVEVASRFINDGEVVVFEESEGGKKAYKAEGGKRFDGMPIVVLVNEGSASASEILAGALKDYGLATLIGKTTFGKGLVQGILDMKDGSALKVTVAKWLTPNGENINENGIAPDIEVDYTYEDYENGIDPQLDKAIEMLKQ